MITSYSTKVLRIILILLFSFGGNCYGKHQRNIMDSFNHVGKNVIFPTCNIKPFEGDSFSLKDNKDKVIVMTIWDRNDNMSLFQLIFSHSLSRHFQDDIENNRIIFINAYRKSILPKLEGWGNFKNEKKLIDRFKKIPATKKLDFFNITYGKIESENFLKFVYKLFKTNKTPITLVFKQNLICLGAFLYSIDIKNKDFGKFLQKAMDGTLNNRKKRRGFWNKVKRFFGL